MPGPAPLLSKDEVLELLQKIIDYLLENPTTYSWKSLFLYSRRLNPTYLTQYANRDSDVKELWKIVNLLGSENCDRAIQAGLLNPGYGKWRLLCMKNSEYISTNESLQNEKIKTEISNIKSQTALIETEIKIGWDDE